MISIQKRFLFIHVPKTAGNSIQNILRDYSEDQLVSRASFQDGVERFGVRNKNYKLSKHATFSHYKAALDADIFRSLYKFAVIRNPWERLISFYFSSHRGAREWNRNDFIYLINNLPSLRQYVCEKPLLVRISQRIGMRWLSEGKKLDADINFLMKFENLDDDFKIVCRQLAIPPTPLPRRNISTRAHYSKYYDDALIEMVRYRFADDIKYGSYEFEYV